MKKALFETKDFLSFEPHEWEQISVNPVIYEALKDNIILKFRDWEQDTEYPSIKTQKITRLVFKKGNKVEVTVSGDKFHLSLDDDLHFGDSMSLEMIDDDP